MIPCYVAAAMVFHQVLEGASPFPPQGFCTCYFICLETSFSATRTTDSFPHPPGPCRNVPRLERLPLSVPPPEGPSLDIVVICPGLNKALTTVTITLLNCYRCFTLAQRSQPRLHSASFNPSKVSTHHDFCLTGLQWSLDTNWV